MAKQQTLSQMLGEGWQLTGKKVLALRGLLVCSARATSSLPAPVGPSTKTGRSSSATWVMSSRNRHTGSVSPIIPIRDVSALRQGAVSSNNNARLPIANRAPGLRRETCLSVQKVGSGRSRSSPTNV
ncbi:MAG: hypothetical protein AAFX99_05305, partial [Myxococcota bacterium]